MEEGEVAALEGKDVAEFAGLAPGFGVQLGVRVEGDDDLVVQDVLVVQVEAGQGQAEDLGALVGRGGGEFEGEIAGEQPKLVEEGVEVAFLDVESVLAGCGAEQGTQLVDRVGAHHDLVSESAVRGGCVIDDVLGPAMLSGVVEVFQAEGSVDGDDPVAGLVGLVEEGSVCGVEGQDGARHVPWRLSGGGHAGRRGGKQRG